ncbi:hypothetical protein [Candidatus Uabimicrobium sp. HlEnr_7]|uniref:hypothetical protein n=1 Tax=Candidatus Uabimicrobium helgolandensis TaxID=3095367 RepID=UPI00355608A0
MQDRQETAVKNWTSHEDIVAHFESGTQGLFFLSLQTIRRIIRLHRQLNVFYLSVPHSNVYSLTTEDFVRILNTYDSILKEKILYQQIETEYVTLVAVPSKSKLRKHGIHYFAREFWSLIFHAQIDIKCRSSSYLNDLTDVEIKSLFTPIIFAEIRAVLYQENRLFDVSNDKEVLQEFLSFYFEMFYFHRELIKSSFPSLCKCEVVVSEIAQKINLDFENFLEQSRPQIASFSYLEKHSKNSPDQVINNILAHLAFLDENKKGIDVSKNYNKFITLLVSQIVQIEELCFADICNLAIREKVYVSKKILFAIDQLMVLYFPRNYSKALYTQKIVVYLRSREKVVRDVYRFKARKISEVFVNQLSNYTNIKQPKLTNEIIRSFTGYFFYYLLFGWLIHFITRNLSLSFTWALRSKYYFDKILFRKYYIRFLWVSEKRNIGRGILNLRQAQAILERATYCSKSDVIDRIKKDLQQQYEEYIKPVSEYLIKDLNLDERDRTDFHNFIDYLSKKIRREKWCTERFILLDLENAYIDGNTKFCELSVRSWMFSFAKEKLISGLPYNSHMRRLKHLRAACKKTQKIELDEKTLERYVYITHKALEKTKQKVSEQIGPIVLSAMAEQNFHQKTLEEKVAFEKVYQGYLDVMTNEGYSYFAKLRDLVSRNRVTLENLETKQIFTGDQLIKLDRLLGKKLRGVHRPAEIYVRFLQIISSIFFGTPTGRFICKFFFFPFGGAVILMVLMQMLLESFVPGIDLISAKWVFSTSAGLQIFFYVEFSRTWLKKFVWKPLVYVGSIPIKTLQRIPTILKKIILLPFLGSLAIFSLLYFQFYREVLLYKPSHWSNTYYYQIVYAACIFIAFLFFNSRLGTVIKNIFIEIIALVIQALGRGLLIRFLSFLLYLSRILLEKIEHASYIVSDYLRLIYGAKYTTSFFKAFIALIWFPLAYIITLYIVLFLEPQINPLKFPIVSITYKLLFVFPETYLQILTTLQDIASFILPAIAAYSFAWFTGFVFTGLFGFLGWELKENWQLYKENWRKFVSPAKIGKKGKTIVQFLRPGFHSGDIPHLFDKLRTIKTKNIGNQQAFNPALPLEREMKGIKRELQIYVERDFLWVVGKHPLFCKDFSLKVTNISCTYNTISIDISIVNKEQKSSLCICFQEKEHRLIATSEISNLGNWSISQQQVFAYILAVFYKKSSTDLVREHIEFYLNKRYSDYELNSEMFYDIQTNYVNVNLKQENQKMMSLQNIRRKFFATKNIYQERMYLDRNLLFSKHKFLWKDFNKITKEEHFSHGKQYLHFLKQN